MEVEHNSSVEQNTSMEELKVDEDESNKETSLEEDILGAQSLLMSDSDEESNQKTDTTNNSPFKKISPKRTKRILDSDDEKEENPGKDEEVAINSIKSNNKISALIDTDSEQDEENTESETKLSTKVLIDKETNVDETQKIDFKQIKQGLKKKSNKTSKKMSPEGKIDEKFVKKTTKKSNKTKKDTGLENSSGTSKKKSKKVTSLIDSETDESATHTENDTEGDDNEEHLREKEKKPRAIRASAKKALDEMQAIQSEQQRLHREAHISIPYHKPKKHTLEEFLKRRTIIQPPLQASNDCTAATVVHAKSLKMTPEELEEYAKLMEEREKEATEFFKSESESEGEVFKDNEGVLDKLSEIQQSNGNKFTNKDAFSKTEAEDSHHINTAVGEEIKENLDGVQLTEEELAELLAEQNPILEEKNNDMQESPTCSKVLITEVIELPKLDMNTVRFSPVKKPTPRPSLNIKELLRQKNLSGSPSLSGDPNKLIDLETGNLIEKKPTGIENLMKRLMATVKHKKSKKSEICNILSVENGKLEMSKVNVILTETKDLQKEPKPGAAYFELKKSLKEIIKKKRLDELHKKQEDELEYNNCLADDGYDEEYVDNAEEAAQEDEEEAEENEMEEETNENKPDIKPTNKVIVVDDEENALVVEEDEENEESFENEENIVDLNSDDEDENLDNDYEQEYVNDSEERDDEEEEDNSDDNKKTIEFTQISERKNRIIKPLNDSDDENDKDDIDFLKTQPPATQPPLFDTQPSQKTALEDEETELIDLCSGTFDATQKTTSKAALMSQIPLTQNNGQTMNDNELIELCSGTFDEAIIETPTQPQCDETSDKVKPKCNKILSSDDEDCDDDDQEKSIRNKGRVKKLTKRISKRKAKLGFSDDEEEEQDEDIVDSEECKEDEINEEQLTEEPETFVDYDSEENEILVQMTKKDKVKQAQNFVENEAELSESDWGSADEDEKNLDTYDIELGDEDEFDKDKLQTELGQIHARKMLDEDIREVRKIQDMLFEDEERDGVGRQRTFRWKNAESGFSLEDGHQLELNGDGENGDSGDEINEHQWRKIRFEREQFLKEHGLKPGSQDMSTVVMNTATQSVNSVVSSTTATTTKKLQIITTKKTSVSISNSKKSSPFLISKGIGNMNKKSVRGSFLVRDKETLNKLAGITKGTASAIAGTEMDETAGTVSIKNIKPNNFVFATLTEEEHESLKRKADDLNSSGENGKNFMKKPKLEPRRDKCLIDQLL